MEDLDALQRAFSTLTLPKTGWTHAAHLRVGAWHVQQLGPEPALVALRDGIRRLNASHGVANTETGGYHETITAAYVRVIAAFLATFDDAVTLAARVDALVAGPLGERDFLFRFWSRERLLSSRARATWVEPDLAALDDESVRQYLR